MAKWKVKLGDLWVIPSKTARAVSHSVVCGDATNAEDVARAMGANKRAAICFTSPPYALGGSVSLHGNQAASARGNLYTQHDDGDLAAWRRLMDGMVALARKVTDAQIINVQLVAGNKRELARWLGANADWLVDVLVWDKESSGPCPAVGVVTSTFEFLVILGGKDASRSIPHASWNGSVKAVYRAPPQRGNEFAEVHGATMPLHLPAWVLSTLCDHADSVYEPFCGTGTTIVAAEGAGRRCAAIEIDPKYVAVTLERLEGMGLAPQLVS